MNKHQRTKSSHQPVNQWVHQSMSQASGDFEDCGKQVHLLCAMIAPTVQATSLGSSMTQWTWRPNPNLSAKRQVGRSWETRHFRFICAIAMVLKWWFGEMQLKLTNIARKIVKHRHQNSKDIRDLLSSFFMKFPFEGYTAPTLSNWRL